MRRFLAGALTVITVAEVDAHGCLWVLFPAVAVVACLYVLDGMRRWRAWR